MKKIIEITITCLLVALCVAIYSLLLYYTFLLSPLLSAVVLVFIVGTYCILWVSDDDYYGK